MAESSVGNPPDHRYAGLLARIESCANAGMRTRTSAHLRARHVSSLDPSGGEGAFRPESSLTRRPEERGARTSPSASGIASRLLQSREGHWPLRVAARTRRPPWGPDPSELGARPQPEGPRRIHERMPASRLEHRVEDQHVHPAVGEVAAPGHHLVATVGRSHAHLGVDQAETLAELLGIEVRARVHFTDVEPVRVRQEAPPRSGKVAFEERRHAALPERRLGQPLAGQVRVRGHQVVAVPGCRRR